MKGCKDLFFGDYPESYGYSAGWRGHGGEVQ